MVLSVYLFNPAPAHEFISAKLKISMRILVFLKDNQVYAKRLGELFLVDRGNPRI